MEKKLSFEELKKEAIEAMNKRNQETFVRTHEMIQRDMERRRQERKV